MINQKWQYVDTQDGGQKEIRLITSTCASRADSQFANQDVRDLTIEHRNVILPVSNDGPDATLYTNRRNLVVIQEGDPVFTKAEDAQILL